MVERKPAVNRAPARPELDRMVAKAREIGGASDEQLLEQRISFAYGNAPAGSRITKDSVRMASGRTRLTTD